MRDPFLQWCRTGSYFLFAALFLTLGYWIPKHISILNAPFDNYVLLVLRESPYQSFMIPFWLANVIAGVFLFCTLFLIVPFIQMLRRPFPFIIFCILLLLCVLPLHIHFDTGILKNQNRLLDLSYRLISCSIGIFFCIRGFVDISNRTNLLALLDRFFLWISAIRSSVFLVGSFISCLIICGFISWNVFDGVPGFVDSCAYMFQARLFAHGMLYAPPPNEPQFFGMMHTIISEKWFTVYPPGYPALLALGVIFKISWLVNPLLAALTIVCIYMIAKELYGDSIAKLSAVLSCASSFFLFMSSEFASHTSTLFFVTLAFLCFVWMIKKKRPLLSAVACGTCIGIALLCRPYTTFWICVPMGIAAVIKRKELSLLHILIGFIPIIVSCFVFLAYNYATTGNPLLFGYIAAHGEKHYPGFHQDPWSGQFHTVTQGFKYVLEDLNALNYYLFEWPVPALIFVCIFLAYGKKGYWEWLLVGWTSALLVGHFFYFFNQLDFGPRFVYECLPALILLTSRGISLSTQFIVYRWKTLSVPHARNTLCLMLIGFFLFAFLFNVQSTAKSYKKSYGNDVNIQKYLDQNDVKQALVFVKAARAYWVHYPFNAPFAQPHIYAKDRGSVNKKLAEDYPGYRYFIADEELVVEVSIDELQQDEVR